MFSAMKKKRSFLLGSLLVLLLCCFMTVNAEAGWKKNSNGTYSYYSDGKLVKSKWIDNNTYYVNSKGIRQKGWLYLKSNWYYFNKSTGKLIKSKWIKSGKSTYYASETGALYLNGRYKIGEDYYSFNKRGAMLTGKQTIDKKTYYFSNKTGKQQNKTWVSISKKYYYFGSDGAMYKSKWVGRYYVNSSGVRVISKWQDDRYLGTNGKALSGLQKIGGVYYYFDTKTYKRVTNTSVVVNGKTYKFDKDGKGTLTKKTNGAPATKVNVENTYYTDKVVDDETLLAAIIYCEAGNQPYTGQLAVGMVIMNRVNSSLFPSKLAENIYQKQQFTPARDGSLTRALNNPAIVTDACKKAAAEIMSQLKTKGPNEVPYLMIDKKKTEFPYLFFMTPAAYKRLGLTAKTLKIEGHVFFKTWK